MARQGELFPSRKFGRKQTGPQKESAPKKRVPAVSMHGQGELFELKKSTPWEKGLETYRKNVGELRPETIKKIQDLFHRFQLEEKHWYSPETAEFFSAKNVYHLLYALKIPPLKVSHMNQFTYWPVFKEIPADERMQAIARKKAPEVRKVFEKWREWKKKQAGEKA